MTRVLNQIYQLQTSRPSCTTPSPTSRHLPVCLLLGLLVRIWRHHHHLIMSDMASSRSSPSELQSTSIRPKASPSLVDVSCLHYCRKTASRVQVQASPSPMILSGFVALLPIAQHSRRHHGVRLAPICHRAFMYIHHRCMMYTDDNAYTDAPLTAALAPTCGQSQPQSVASLCYSRLGLWPVPAIRAGHRLGLTAASKPHAICGLSLLSLVLSLVNLLVRTRGQQRLATDWGYWLRR